METVATGTPGVKRFGFGMHFKEKRRLREGKRVDWIMAGG